MPKKRANTGISAASAAGRRGRNPTARKGAKAVSKEPEARGGCDANRKAIELLQSWLAGDEEEQKETFEHLKAALDAQPLSNRKRFA